MQIPFKLLLVHNFFRKEKAVTYLSWFIRLVTFSSWNHIAIAVYILGEWYVIEAIAGGVVLRPYAQWAAHSDRKVKEKLPDFALSQRQFHVLFALIGLPYGYLDLPKVYLVSLYYRLMGKQLSRPVRNGKGFVCSELGALLLGEPWTLVPADFDHLPQLKDGVTFYTKRSPGSVKVDPASLQRSLY